MIYVFLADGFEETEAIAPIDILKRFGKEVVTVGIGGGKITGAHGITVIADITDSDVIMTIGAIASVSSNPSAKNTYIILIVLSRHYKPH